MRKDKKWVEKSRQFKQILNDRIICPNCGHSVLFNRKDKKICEWCKHYVFKNDKVEFEYRLKESMNKKK